MALADVAGGGSRFDMSELGAAAFNYLVPERKGSNKETVSLAQKLFKLGSNEFNSRAWPQRKGERDCGMT